MQIFISRNGEQLGAWTEEEVRYYFQTGNLIATDHYWWEGMADWDTLGRLLAPNAPAATPTDSTKTGFSASSATPPSARPFRWADKKRTLSDFSWLIPYGLACIASIFLGPLASQTQPVARLVLLLVIIAFGVSFLLRRSWRLPVRGLLVLLFGILVIVGRQHQSRARPIAESQNPAAQQQQIEHPQIAQDGHPQVGGQKIDTEAPKLQNTTKGEDDRKISETSIAVMKAIAARGQACRDAEKPMLELSMNASKITSVDELEKRRTAIQDAQAAIQNLVAYLKDIDSTVRQDLLAKGVSARDADSFLSDMNKDGKIEAMVTYWQQENAICGDLLANLDILKKNWGQWHMDGETLAFNDDAALTEYKANITKVNVDVALQKTAQDKMLPVAQ